MKARYLLCFIPAASGCADIIFDARHHSKGAVDSGEDVNSTRCNYDSTDMGVDEVTPLGFPASDVLGLAIGSHASTFEWASTEAVSDLSLELTLDGSGVLYMDGESTGTTECPDSAYPVGAGAAIAIRASSRR